jgi:hypothetical protein
MKRTILNLLAVALMSLNWNAQAAETADRNASGQPVAETSAVPMETSPEATPLAAASVSRMPLKPSRHYKRPKANQPRSLTLDLRHCLELGSNAEIAQCAGE